ncbi:1650_t:CDS:2 [Funneliformis geosporum]|uniref:1650_t:CDS:1 n=1 Tax=Funneliformis geosporum TaxID=1117311 RepID=A0A9W4SYI1_9GLOM|nr:1650_t:CDS:2 [Funneliformis geosporum]
MEFLEFLNRYLKLFPKATPEQVNEVFQISIYVPLLLKKRKWFVNSTIKPEHHNDVYFVDPTEMNYRLIKLVYCEEYVLLYSSHTFGKSTRSLRAMKQLSKYCYICIYVTLDDLEFDDVTSFWRSFESADQFGEAFLKMSNLLSLKEKNMNLLDKPFIIFIDEFDILLSPRYEALLSFNIRDSFSNPNFTKDQVKILYKEFMDEYEIEIEEQVIEDIYAQTNGHAGLVNLCEPKYGTFDRLIKSLSSSDVSEALDLLRTHFLISLDVEDITNTTDIKLAEFLISEGVLRNNDTIDTLKVLQKAINFFDKCILKRASALSYKIALMKVNKETKVKVSRESVYDTELSRNLINWLSKERRFEVVDQWHLSKPLPNGEYEHNYSDKQRVSRNFDRALTYADQLSAGEKWVVHFTCCENHIANPLWPTKEELEKGLQVVIVWHDLDFMTVRMVAYLWDEEYKMVHVTEVEEFKWDL